jgi:nicotinate-nucleotide pyrophosphorylase
LPKSEEELEELLSDEAELLLQDVASMDDLSTVVTMLNAKLDCQQDLSNQLALRRLKSFAKILA